MILIRTILDTKDGALGPTAGAPYTLNVFSMSARKMIMLYND
jgi:hypothetical protein